MLEEESLSYNYILNITIYYRIRRIKIRKFIFLKFLRLYLIRNIISCNKKNKRQDK